MVLFLLVVGLAVVGDLVVCGDAVDDAVMLVRLL